MLARRCRQAAAVKHQYPIAGSGGLSVPADPRHRGLRRTRSSSVTNPPKDFHEWGKCFEYKYNAHNTPLPEDIRHTWTRYNNTAAIYDKHVTEGPTWMRNTLSAIAGWRLKKGQYEFPIEQKLFDLYVRMTGQTQAGTQDYAPAIDA